MSSENNLKELLSIIQNPTPADKALITKAYNFAKLVHKDHKRFSGEPYFDHLFATAKNLANLHMGAITISAGFLHDCIEDVNVLPATLEKEFGSEILFLVDGVTTLGHVRYQGAERHTESLRKFFVAMSKDLRVLIIKLADRLHNMETLQHVKKEKQCRIARETLEIYAPLAYRLGIRKLSRDLSDLSFPFVYPEEYKKTTKILSGRLKKENFSKLEKILRSIKKELAKANITNFSSSYRIKSLYNLYKKLENRDWDIDKIHDLSAVRIIVPNVQDCYQVLGVIHGNWRPLPGRIKDYISFPKLNGYQGVHTTVFTGDGSIIEVQIRTQEMNKEAEYGIASHFSYKEGIPSDTLLRGGNLEWVKKFLPSFTVTSVVGQERETPLWIEQLKSVESFPNDPSKFMKHLTEEFFSDRVFVFTPKGDVLDLPAGASPLDFAYSIHSHIGDHLSGAKVNGKLVSIDHPLKNSDIVEIITKESSRPSAKWLNFVKTNVAKKHIRSVLNIAEQAEKKPAKKRKKITKTYSRKKRI